MLASQENRQSLPIPPDTATTMALRLIAFDAMMLRSASEPGATQAELDYQANVGNSPPAPPGRTEVPPSNANNVPELKDNFNGLVAELKRLGVIG